VSHPNPSYDPDNSYEDDDMVPEHDPSDALLAEYLYDDYNDFHDDDAGDFDMTYYNDPSYEEDNVEDDDYDDSMDGDHESALSSAGWGTDEDYGYCYYGDDF